MDKPRVEQYQFGEFVLDCGARQLLCGGKVISLTPKEFQTLVVLVEARGRAVEREAIMRSVWPDTVVGDTSLGRNISVLRRHLGVEAVESVPRFGYRFVPVVTKVKEQEVAVADAGTPPLQQQSRKQSAQQRSAWVAPTWVSAARMLAVIILAGGVLSLKKQRLAVAATEATAAKPVQPILLAVLPFRNLSVNAGDSNYLRDGFVEELTARLGALDYAYLRVLARSTTRQYEDTKLQPAEIGAQTGARYLLEGSVRFEHGRAKVSANLVDVRDQTIVWSQVIDRPVGQMVAEEEAIVDALAISPAFSDTNVRRSVSAESESRSEAAHDEYLQGRYEIAQGRREAFARALEHFQRAVAIDPEYARGYEGIAEAYIYRTDALPLAFCYAKSRAATMTALRLDAGMGDAHRNLAYLDMNDRRNLREAEAEYRRAIQLEPDDVRSRSWYAQLLAAERRFPESIAQASAAYELDPRSARTMANYGFILTMGGRTDDGVKMLESALRIDPDSEMAWGYLGTGYRLQRRYAESAAAFDRAAGYYKSDKAYSAGAAYARAENGDPSEANQLLKRWQPLLQRHEWVPAQSMAILELAVGNKESAVDWLRLGIQDRTVELFELNTEPIYGAMKDKPRFPQLLAEAGAVR
jgi:DNA-binding winged helix-turn-helix (wHTH) protein/TolB-like protein/Tfp pilus assembly protein PilF